MSKHISRNGGATIMSSRKTAHAKSFFYFEAKRPFFPNKLWHHEKGYSPKSVYWYQCFSVWKKVDGESLVHDKVVVLKKHFLQK